MRLFFLLMTLVTRALKRFPVFMFSHFFSSFFYNTPHTITSRYQISTEGILLTEILRMEVFSHPTATPFSQKFFNTV